MAPQMPGASRDYGSAAFAVELLAICYGGRGSQREAVSRPCLVWFCLWQTAVQFNTLPLDSLNTLTEVCLFSLLHLESFGVSTRAKHPSSLLPSGLLLSIQTKQHPPTTTSEWPHPSISQ